MSKTRRALLAGGAVTFVGIALGVPAFLNMGRPQAGVAAIVRRVFGGDVASDADIKAFAKAFVDRFHGLAPGRAGRLLAGATPELLPVLAVAPFATGLEKLGSHLEIAEAEVTLSFIRATNYVFRKPGKPVTFEALPIFEPYACLNPVARFDFDD